MQMTSLKRKGHNMADIGDNLTPLLVEYGNLRADKKDIEARLKELEW